MSEEAGDRRSTVEAALAIQTDTLRRVRACVPANVTAYRPGAPPAVDVQVARNQQPSGGGSVPGPLVPSVPILYTGAGSWSLFGPLEVGDDVLLLIPDRSIAGWLALGRSHEPDDDDRAFSLADALALPVRVSRPSAAALAALAGTVGLRDTATAAGVYFEPDGSTATLEALVSIVLGSTGSTEPVALATSLLAALDSAISAAIAATAPNDGGSAALAAFKAAWDTAKGDAIASKVSAE